MHEKRFSGHRLVHSCNNEINAKVTNSGVKSPYNRRFTFRISGPQDGLKSGGGGGGSLNINTYKAQWVSSRHFGVPYRLPILDQRLYDVIPARESSHTGSILFPEATVLDQLPQLSAFYINIHTHEQILKYRLDDHGNIREDFWWRSLI